MPDLCVQYFVKWSGPSDHCHFVIAKTYSCSVERSLHMLRHRVTPRLFASFPGTEVEITDACN